MVAVDLTDQYWVVGSGASTHLVRDASMLYELEDCDDLHSIFLLDKSTLRVTRREKARFRLNVNDGGAEDYVLCANSLH